MKSKDMGHLIIGPWNHWFETALEHDEGKNHQYGGNELIRSFKWFHDILVKNFVARIINFDNEGKSHYVRGGIASLVSSLQTAYEPNSIVKISIDMCNVGWLFKKGTCIRLDVQSSDFPQYSIHSNTAGCWSMQNETVCAEQKLYFGRECVSCLELPMVR